MLKQRKATRFRIGDILVYNNGMKWQYVDYCKFKLLQDNGDYPFPIGFIKKLNDEHSDWVAPGYKIINFQAYVEQANRLVSEGSN